MEIVKKILKYLALPIAFLLYFFRNNIGSSILDLLNKAKKTDRTLERNADRDNDSANRMVDEAKALESSLNKAPDEDWHKKR